MSWFDLSRFTGRLRPGTTIVRVSGGLANQMLCYKLGRYLAEMRKEKLILDASSYDRDPPDRNRNFQLTKYPIRYDELVESKVAMRRLDERNPLTFISREMCAVHSTAERADLIQRIQSAPILLCDLWLSLALREELDDAARRNGTLDDLTLEWQKWFDDRDRELLSLIKSSADPVAIHVRRGDFATHDGNLLVTADYYNASIAEITGRLPEALFVVSRTTFRGAGQIFDSIRVTGLSTGTTTARRSRTCISPPSVRTSSFRTSQRFPISLCSSAKLALIAF